MSGHRNPPENKFRGGSRFRIQLCQHQGSAGLVLDHLLDHRLDLRLHHSLIRTATTEGKANFSYGTTTNTIECIGVTVVKFSWTSTASCTQAGAEAYAGEASD